MKKRIAAVIMAAVMTISAAIPAFAGTWTNYGGKWYFSDPTVNYNNDFLTGWQWIDGYCYYMDPDAGGAMLVDTISPDGFPVDELGRMTDSAGEPYYIPGYGLNATTAGPGDYTDDTIYSSYYDYDDLLAELLDLLYGNHYDDRARRRNDEPRRRDSDTITVQIEVVGGQPDKAQDPAGASGQPDKAEDSAGIAGQRDNAVDPAEAVQDAIKRAQESAEKAEGSAEKAEEQTSDSVISAGSSQSQDQNSQSSSGQTTQDHTERPAQRQRGQAGAGSSSSAGGSTEDENFPLPLLP